MSQSEKNKDPKEEERQHYTQQEASHNKNKTWLEPSHISMAELRYE